MIVIVAYSMSMLTSKIVIFRMFYANFLNFNSIRFFNEALLTEKNFKFSSLDTYFIPDDTQDVLVYLKNLPTGSDHPEAFGQHPNADINAQMVIL